MVDSELSANILLKYVDPYVEERNRYDETQMVIGGRKVPGMSSLVLTLKCLAVLIKKLSVSQIEVNMNMISPLIITVCVLVFVGGSFWEGRLMVDFV
jgi:hypothetical protein